MEAIASESEMEEAVAVSESEMDAISTQNGSCDPSVAKPTANGADSTVISFHTVSCLHPPRNSIAEEPTDDQTADRSPCGARSRQGSVCGARSRQGSLALPSPSADGALETQSLHSPTHSATLAQYLQSSHGKAAGKRSFAEVLKMLEAAHENELGELRRENMRLRGEKVGEEANCGGDESMSLACSEIYRPDDPAVGCAENLRAVAENAHFRRAESVQSMQGSSQQPHPVKGPFAQQLSVESFGPSASGAAAVLAAKNRIHQENANKRNGFGAPKNSPAGSGIINSRRNSLMEKVMERCGIKSDGSRASTMNANQVVPVTQSRFTISDRIKQQADFDDEQKPKHLLPGKIFQCKARSRQGSLVGLHLPPSQSPMSAATGLASGRNSFSSNLFSATGMKRGSDSSEASAMTMLTLPGQSVPQNSQSALGKMLIEEGELAQKVQIMRQMCDSDVSLLFRLWANYTEHMKRLVKFQPLGTWTQDYYSNATMHHLSRGASGLQRRASQTRDSRETDIGFCEMTMSKHRRCIVKPGSPLRITWDLMGALLLLFDVVMIPMSVFSADRSQFETVMDWLTLIFWTFDMYASCVTGYIHMGMTVLHPWLILRNYLRTWFMIDLIVVGPDWGFTIYEMVSGVKIGGGGNSSKLLRTLRVLRMCRMLRLVKLKRVLVMIRDRIDSENLFILLSIVKMMVMLLLVNHFLASIWYALGDLARSFELKNWIEMHDFQDKPLADRYTVAYHWSLTQFSPASMDVQPHNVWERIYAITVLVCGLILFSSFISSVTASITQVRNREGDKSKQFWLLRRYLRQHGIQAQLTFRILRYVEYACSEQQNTVPESSIWVLQLLSTQLRNELNYSVSFSSLKVHPFFDTTNTVSRVTMVRLSESAMTLQSLACNDLIVTPGTIVDSMYMVVTGHLLYVHAEEAVVPDCEEEVRTNDWICEPVLWTEWFALGEVAADTESRVVAINKDKFGRIVQQEYIAWKLASHYAKNFVHWLSTRTRGELTDVMGCEEMMPIVSGFIDAYFNKRESQSVRESMASISPDLKSRFKSLNLKNYALMERASGSNTPSAAASARSTVMGTSFSQIESK